MQSGRDHQRKVANSLSVVPERARLRCDSVCSLNAQKEKLFYGKKTMVHLREQKKKTQMERRAVDGGKSLLVI